MMYKRSRRSQEFAFDSMPLCALSSRDHPMKLIKSVFTLAAYCALMALLTGCSSILCGQRQSLSISSKPAGAEVLVYNPQGDIVFQNKTPCVASLARSTPEEGRANYIIL